MLRYNQKPAFKLFFDKKLGKYLLQLHRKKPLQFDRVFVFIRTRRFLANFSVSYLLAWPIRKACVKCRANYLPIYDISNASDQAQKNHTKFDSSGTFISKVSTRQEITECISEASITQITNCEKYYRIGVSDFGCVSCAFGFIGKVSNSRREIVECVDAQQSQCDASKRFEGLGWESTSVKSLKFPLGMFHISS